MPYPDLLPDELAAIEAMGIDAPARPEIVDPWEGIAAVPPREEVADPYQAAAAMGYGPQTSGQMASPDAPMFLPPTPPAPAGAKNAYSATDSQREVLGKTVATRDVDADVARLGQLRSPAQPAKQAGPGRNEQEFTQRFAGQDDKARKAFMLNWFAGGPEQAYRFQEAYDRRRQAASKGLDDARAKDLAETRGKAPISDAQAQILVRTYGMTPEAVANMTAEQWAEIEPIMKSAPYAYNQSQSREQKTDVDLAKILAGVQKSQLGAATSVTNTQLRGQNALNTVKANKKGGGGGGGPPVPRDIRSALIATYGAEAAPQVDQVIEALQSGVSPQEIPPELQEIAAQYKLYEGAPGKEWAKVPLRLGTGAGVARTNQRTGADVRVEAQHRDVSEAYKAGEAYRSMATPFITAYRSAGKLGPKKLAYLAKVGTDTTGALAKQYGLTEADRAELASVRQFVTQYAYSMGGKALTESEIKQLQQTTGVNLGDKTSLDSVLQSPQVLIRFLDGMRKVLSEKKKSLLHAYPDALGGASGP